MKPTLNLTVPCLFGLEGIVAKELRRMGLAGVTAENGRVGFTGDYEAVALANLGLSCGERVLIELGSFEAKTFDELFEGIKALPLEDYIPRDGAFPVKGHSLSSALHSIPDCQKIIKKAAADRLSSKYSVPWLPESGETYQMQFSIMSDHARLYLDTSGIGLHKRGYRPVSVAAPLRETLAAAMISIAKYRGRGDFYDPFCGSGTIAIEAALAAKNRAPGINRAFAAEKWRGFPEKIWPDTREKLRAAEYSGKYSITASDIDEKAIEIARQNAERAGVADCIHFIVKDAISFDKSIAGGAGNGVIVTNPPYGERIMEKREAERLYALFGKAYRKTTGLEAYILSSHTEFERSFGSAAAKKRKLYNGMIKCELYIYPAIL